MNPSPRSEPARLISRTFRRLRRSLPVAPFLLAAALTAPAAPPPVPIEVGSRLAPLVDDYLIDCMKGVQLKLHEPTPAGTALVFDQPWEGVTCGYVKVFKDGDLYKMYYRGSSDPSYTMMSGVKPGEPIVPSHVMCTCYAESKDGITWTRPKLGLYEFNGSKDNNIVWVGVGTPSFSPFKDENPNAPADQKYKAVASSNGDGDKKKPVLLAFVSPDGKNWKQLQEKPIITDGAFDSLNVVFWDTVRSQYTAIYRDFIHGVRGIKYASSKDFVNWTAGEWADFGEAPAEHLYTNATVPYPRAPHIYVAMPRRFNPWKTYYPEMEAVTPGVSDAVFMTTRDGVHWKRFEEAFVRPGLDQRNWVHRANTPSLGILETSPEEMSFFIERNYTFPTNRVDRLTIRTDGFVSANAGFPGGEFTTKPLVFTGTSVALNYSTAANGSIRIEVQDINGQPIEGFRLEDSPTIFGDKISEVVPWKHPKGRTDRSPFSRLAGKPIRLRFVMRDADIYSIQFK